MNHKPLQRLRRRGFLGGTLIAAGAAAGWWVRRHNRPETRARQANTRLDDRFAYDVSEFEKTDPDSLLYEPAGEFGSGLTQVKRLADWPGNGVLVTGGRVIRIFDNSGGLRGEWTLEQTPHCLHALTPDRLLVGFANRFAIYDPVGREQSQSPVLGPRTYLTSLTATDDQVFAADAGNREVIICSRQTGEVRRRFGRKDAATGNPGFNVPSPYFALALAADQRLRVANPGLLRIETYTLDGRFVSAWGEPGMKIDRFCGCCNPVYFVLTRHGEFVTSEKGLARINIYTAAGVFKGAVAGPETLVTDKQLAKQACHDCTVGAGFDVTVAENGDVLTLDPYRQVVRRFQPKGPS